MYRDDRLQTKCHNVCLNDVADKLSPLQPSCNDNVNYSLSTLDSHPSTLNPQPSTFNPQPSTIHPCMTRKEK